MLYCQQNGLTNVCAHVALRTCISAAIPAGDFSCSNINKILADNGKAHKIGDGLSVEQILIVLDKLSIKYSRQFYGKKATDVDEDNSKTIKIPYQAYLYSSIESGYPALLAFSCNEGESAHIIPILGHTFNENTWVPHASRSYFVIGEETKYVPSETWVTTYICHDDNFGSYYCLPQQYLENNNHIALVIALNPPSAEYDAIIAEAIAADYLYTLVPEISKQVDKVWMKRLIDSIVAKDGWFVLRTTCMPAKKYIEHLGLLRGWDNKTIPKGLITALEKELLLDSLWVVEISLPELFPANRRKLGEIVLNPKIKISKEKDLSSFLFARILDKIYFFKNNADGKIGLVSFDANIDTHTELYKR